MLRRLVYVFTNYDGRIRRRTFWLSLPLLVPITLLIVLVGLIVDVLIHTQIDPLLPSYAEWYPVTVVALVLSWYPQMAVVIKRLHDRNKRARWLWLAFFPYLGWIWLLIETGFMRGTKGPNDWGDDPRATRGTAPEPVGAEAR